MEDHPPQLKPKAEEYLRIGKDIEEWLDRIPQGIMFLNLPKEEIIIIHTAILILKRESYSLQEGRM